MRHPEIYEWEVEAPDQHMMLICCDGFFSKNAFVSPESVTRFCADPVGFCRRKDFFRGTCLEVLMEEMGESDLLPDPSKVGPSKMRCRTSGRTLSATSLARTTVGSPPRT